MSADEAAAKADALIAQYRAAAPRAKRGAPRVSEFLLPRADWGTRLEVAAVFVLGFVAGLIWRAHPVWGGVLALVAMVLGRRVVRRARSDAIAADDAADR